MAWDISALKNRDRCQGKGSGERH